MRDEVVAVLTVEASAMLLNTRLLPPVTALLPELVEAFDVARTSGRFAEGRGVGVGLAEGRGVGVADGRGVGVAEGRGVGLVEGRGVGLAEGRGAGVGLAEGRGIGLAEDRGVGVGIAEGRGVGVGVAVPLVAVAGVLVLRPLPPVRL